MSGVVEPAALWNRSAYAGRQTRSRATGYQRSSPGTFAPWPAALRDTDLATGRRVGHSSMSHQCPDCSRKRPYSEQQWTAEKCHSTKSLRDSPLRGVPDCECGNRGEDNR